MAVSTMIEELSLLMTVKLQVKVTNNKLYDCLLVPAKHSISPCSDEAQPCNLMTKLNKPQFATIKQAILEAYDEEDPCESFDFELDVDCTATVDCRPAESDSWDCPGHDEEFELVDLVAQTDNFLDLVGLYDLTYYLESENGLIDFIIEEVKEASAP